MRRHAILTGVNDGGLHPLEIGTCHGGQQSRGSVRQVVPQVPQPLGCPRLAEALLDRAAEGDLTALREVGDRLDGRPAQAITTEVTTPPGMISIKDA